MKYNKIVQKKYCCVGACMEMVLNRHNIKDYDQENIAYQLGLVVPFEDKVIYKKCRCSKKPKSGYGTQIHKEKYSINNFFNKNGIPLLASYHFITDFDEAKNFLLENKNKDILIILHCGTLYNSLIEDWGHLYIIHISEPTRLGML